MRPALFLGLALGTWMGVHGPSARGALVNGIAAVVQNAVITYEDVQNEVQSFLPSLEARYGNQRQAFIEQLRTLERERMELLVERQLILLDFKNSKYQLPESIIDEIIKQRIRERFTDHTTLRRTLQAQGTTYETYRQTVRDQFIIEQMRLKNVSSELIISPFKIEAFYENNRDRFQLSDQVKLRMIVLDAKKHPAGEAEKLAKEIHSKLKEGAAFEEMATIYSDGSQASAGGDWGWVERKTLREDLAEVAFGLKANEISDVIVRPEGFYVMLVEELKSAHLRPISEVRTEIEAELKRNERVRLERKWLERLKSKAFIRYFPRVQ